MSSSLRSSGAGSGGVVSRKAKKKSINTLLPLPPTEITTTNTIAATRTPSLKSFAKSAESTATSKTSSPAPIINSIPIEIEAAMPKSTRAAVSSMISHLPVTTEITVDEKMHVSREDDDNASMAAKTKQVTKKTVSNLKKQGLHANHHQPASKTVGAKVKFSDVELRHLIKPATNSSEDLLYYANEEPTSAVANYMTTFDAHHHHRHHHRPRPYSTPSSSEMQFASSPPLPQPPPTYHQFPILDHQAATAATLRPMSYNLAHNRNYHLLPSSPTHQKTTHSARKAAAANTGIRHSNTVSFGDAVARSRSTPSQPRRTTIASGFDKPYTDFDRFERVSNSFLLTPCYLTLFSVTSK